MSPTPKVAVLFVARGTDGGLASVNEFAEAYALHPARQTHRLVFLTKGWTVATERRQLDKVADSLCADLLEVPDDGFDWGAYFRALPSITESWVCLLNSHSRPLVEGWLETLMGIAAQPGQGLVGATGSWESPRWRPALGDSLRTTFRGAARTIRNLRDIGSFSRFPNPHVRSTGVVTSRLLFEDFAAINVPPKSKHAAHILESGRQGLSRFAIRRGLRLSIVGKDGHAYEIDEWPSSGTFRALDQRNLLIADNRTRDYDLAGKALKQSLAAQAWGPAHGDR